MLEMAEGRQIFQLYMRLTIPVAFSFTMSFKLTIDYHHSQNIRLNFQKIYLALLHFTDPCEPASAQTR